MFWVFLAPSPFVDKFTTYISLCSIVDIWLTPLSTWLINVVYGCPLKKKYHLICIWPKIKYMNPFSDPQWGGFRPGSQIILTFDGRQPFLKTSLGTSMMFKYTFSNGDLCTTNVLSQLENSHYFHFLKWFIFKVIFIFKPWIFLFWPMD